MEDKTMKKLIFILASISVLAVACSKEVSSPDVAPEGLTSGNILSLKALVPPTKINVAPETGDATWKEGDAIAVYNTNGDKFKLTLSEGAGTYEGTFSGDFTGTPDEGSPAIYPYDFAADTPWDVVLPEYIPWEDNVRAVMVAEIDGSGATPDPLHFTHVMSVLEITLKDVPAYARGLQITSEALAQLSGTFTINETNDGVEASGTTTGKQIIHFPYKTGYGADATVKICAVLPAGNYTDLTVCVIDGDEDAIEGTTKAVPASASNLAAGDYVSMKTPLNVRALVGTARDKFVKVEGYKWAKGNLRYWKTAGNAEGWQDGWNVYDVQWGMTGAYAKPTATGRSYGLNLTTTAALLDGGQPAHWDFFTWGNLGENSRLSTPIVKSNSPKHNMAGAMRYATTEPDSNNQIVLDDMTPITVQADKFGADTKITVDGVEYQMYGDVAYWASKGQYRLPKKDELATLIHNGPTHMKGGYCLTPQNGKVYGTYYTSCPSWETPTSDVSAITSTEFTEADLEAGVFLPQTGVGYTAAETYDGATIKQVNNWTVYRSGTYSDTSGFPHAVWTLCGGAAMTLSMQNYSYTLGGAKVCRTNYGVAIRPIYTK